MEDAPLLAVLLFTLLIAVLLILQVQKRGAVPKENAPNMNAQREFLTKHLLKLYKAAEGPREKHDDLIRKFLDIAERKISVLDDYGDERMHLLDGEVDACIAKIAGREGLPESMVRKMLKDDDPSLPDYCFGLRLVLKDLFAEHHQNQRNQPVSIHELGALSV